VAARAKRSQIHAGRAAAKPRAREANAGPEIPPGVETGSRLRLAGKGEGGRAAGRAGDLYVVLHVKPHALFQRKDEDIFIEMPVPFHVRRARRRSGDPDHPRVHDAEDPAGHRKAEPFSSSAAKA